VPVGNRVEDPKNVINPALQTLVLNRIRVHKASHFFLTMARSLNEQVTERAHNYRASRHISTMDAVLPGRVVEPGCHGNRSHQRERHHANPGAELMGAASDSERPCAVITGGAGLLGRAMAIAFARKGMNIVLASTNAENLEAAAVRVRQEGVDVLTVRTDVASPEQMDELAAKSFARFGQVNRLCLNAGNAILKPFDELTRDDWNKVLGVHLGGVLNGVTAFLPQLIRQGGDRHIVLSSSMAGVGLADLRLMNAPYVVSKFAMNGLGEVMAPSLEPHGIGVSILCPGMTVADPAAMSGVSWPMPSAAWYQDNLLNPDQVAAEMLSGIAEKRLYIFSHRRGRDEVTQRNAKVMEGFAQAERTSPPMTRT